MCHLCTKWNFNNSFQMGFLTNFPSNRWAWTWCHWSHCGWVGQMLKKTIQLAKSFKLIQTRWQFWVRCVFVHADGTGMKWNGLNPSKSICLLVSYNIQIFECFKKITNMTLQNDFLMGTLKKITLIILKKYRNTTQRTF